MALFAPRRKALALAKTPALDSFGRPAARQRCNVIDFPCFTDGSVGLAAA
jgi:hypothetical protein